MANPHQKVLRRKMAQAYQHLGRAVEIFLDLGEEFGVHHPDYQEYFQLIAQSAYQTMKFTEDISTKAWGYFPDRIDKWLK